MLSLVCPTDRTPLESAGDAFLTCAAGHRHPIDSHSSIPRLYDLDYGRPFHADSWDPFGRQPDDYPLLAAGEVDDFVQHQIRATGGYLYRAMALRRYPEPRFPFAGAGTVLDVGCGWGRWSIAAANAGWNVASVDPWIDNCRALQRVARQHGIVETVQVVNGDGRRLPFADEVADAAFSYSVLQHLPKEEARAVVDEMVRVVRSGGRVLFQMPNVAGLRQRYLARRGEVADTGFKVRPWTLHELERLASDRSSQWSIIPDGYFSLNAQWSERAAMPIRSRLIVGGSEVPRRVAQVLRPLQRWADSVWVSLTVE